MSAIPLHQLLQRSDIGMEMACFKDGDLADKKEALGIHRDDHYIFFVVEAGSADLMVDFQTVHFPAGSLYFILPGQVHHGIDAGAAYGWFLAVDAGLLTPEQRQVFEQRLLLQQPAVLSEPALARLQNVLTPLYQHYQGDRSAPFFRQVLYALLQAFTGMAAAEYRKTDAGNTQPSRKAEIAHAFKELVSANYRTLKSPSGYAGRLNVSPTYLNESIREVTGFPVSYWITHEVMLEAKRLLFYTQMSVKEIARELGYDDQNYFFRLFRKHQGETPLAFRAHYLE